MEEILDRLAVSGEAEDSVNMRSMMEAIGRRSFGPIIAFLGLIAMSPLSGIPTLPSILGLIVVLVAGQLVLGRTYFWIPNRLLEHSISTDKLQKGLDALRPAGRFIDRLLKPRLIFLTQGAGAYVMAVLCLLVGLTMPPLEILPFLATTAGVALTAFGLAIIANDGLLALIAVAGTMGVAYLVVGHWPIG